MNYMLLPEKDLIVLLKQDDKRALEQLYHTHSHSLFINMLKLVKLPEQATEFIQQVFIELWTHRQNLDADQPFTAYLLKIAGDLVYDFLRKAALNKRAQNILLFAALSAIDNPPPKVKLVK